MRTAVRSLPVGFRHRAAWPWLTGAGVGLPAAQCVDTLCIYTQTMKQKSSSPRSKTNFRRLRLTTDSNVRLAAEHPEIDLKHFARRIVRRGLKVIPPKESVSLRIDADVLKWFKLSGAGYQTRMNAVLRAFKEAAG